MIAAAPPLTLGTAGHVDHGKTALVIALTGVDTDRLPEERERGLSIDLGYAPLELPSGRRLSVVDVPGHERFVRTMVAGATGVDLFLMVVAADDGVMPQTREHAAVLAALGVSRGVVAITKADRMEPDCAAAEAAELFPGSEVVACSARTGVGVPDVAAALERVAAELPGRAAGPSGRSDGGLAGTAGTPVPGCSAGERGAVLHVDRAFTIHGAGTVVTGTLWSGAIARGDTLALLPAGGTPRVRSVQVHNRSVERAQAGQRVALNLSGVPLADVDRGAALVARDSRIEPTLIVDAALDLDLDRGGQRVQVHHGTRDAPARLVALSGRYWQLRLESPLLAATGDRLVVRSVAPPDTLGGGIVLDPRARRHGRRPELIERLARLERGEVPDPSASEHASRVAATPTALGAAALALAERLRAAGHEPPSVGELGEAASELPALRQAGLAIRIGRDLYAHPDALGAVRERVEAIVQAEGVITLARLRDELGTSRKYAQALIEHFDQARVTRRVADDRRVLRRR